MSLNGTLEINSDETCWNRIEGGRASDEAGSETGPKARASGPASEGEYGFKFRGATN